MPDKLDPACNVGRIVKVDASCGCTVTRTSVTGLSPDDIIALSNKEVFLTKAVLDGKEAKMLGVPERGLQELLTSRIKDIGPDLNSVKIDRQSIVQPFIMRTQRSVMNSHYYTIETGLAPTDAGVGQIPAGAWDVILNLGPSWLRTNFTDIQTFFLPGSTLQILTWDNVAAKNAKTLEFTIIRAVNADAGAVAKARVTLAPNYNSAGWAALSAPEKNILHPTFGVAQIGTNSIDNHESYCPIQRSDLSRHIIVDWLQTSRESYCREQSYEEILDLILKGKVNDYLAGFKYQSIADQHKQQAMANRRAWYNSVFFGQVIDVVNQTTANWRNLPIVYDITNTSCPLAYKARAEGIFTKLSNCNRVVDMAGNKLSLDYIFGQLYYLRRNREADGDSIQVIDSMTDRYTASMLFEVMCKYYKKRYELEYTRFFKSNEKITHDGFILFNYNIYDVEEAAVQWAVFVDDYFNDLVDAFASPVVGWDFRTRGRNLWFIDWSDINIGVGEQRQVQRKTPDPDTNALYACVIDANITTYDLRSKMWTVMIDRPQRHLVIHNFTNQCAQTTAGFGCVVPQS